MVTSDDGGARASDGDRDRALAILQEASVHGRLSMETFVTRVDAVLAAQTRGDISEQIADLTSRRAFGDRVLRQVSATSEFIRSLGRSWRRPWLPPLCLPADARRAQTIGRSSDCDLILSDPTVSRRHAQLRPGPNGWELVDLGSMNGTMVNGWRLGTAQAVRAGDVVSFGAISLAVADASLGPRPEPAIAASGR